MLECKPSECKAGSRDTCCVVGWTAMENAFLTVGGGSPLIQSCVDGPVQVGSCRPREDRGLPTQEGRATLGLRPCPPVLALSSRAVPRHQRLPTWPAFLGQLVLSLGEITPFLARTVLHCYFPAGLLMWPPPCQGKKRMVTGPPGEPLTGQREKILLLLGLLW